MGKTRGILTARLNHAAAVADPQTAEQDSSQPSTSGRAHLEHCYAADSTAPAATGTTSRYLCYFLHRLLDFRIPELTALADMAGVPDVQWERPFGGHEESPFWYVHLPSEQAARQIVDRAVLIRGILEVWGEGSSFDEMAAAVQAYPVTAKAPYMAPDVSFRVLLDAWGHTWNEAQQKELFKQLESFLPFEGRVDLKHPQHIFWLCCVDQPSQGQHNGLPDLPRRWYFGRQVALADRSWTRSYALNKRAYIGPTSMDTELAFLMTNMAQVSPHSLVLDPYVGTGSILIAAAARGAYTMGSDIDVRVLKHGRTCPKTGRSVDIYSNYEQYGLQYPLGLVRLDVHRHPFRSGLTEVFNAILGDPPYGVRAGGRKSVAKAHPVRYPSSHIPSTDPYCLTECLADLLELAAQTLVLGGRLVFFMPASPDTYREDQLPCHPSLALLHNTEQLLTTRYSRRLVTMAKVKTYDALVAAQFKEERTGFVMEIDRLHDIVYAQEANRNAAAVGHGQQDGGSGSDTGEGQAAAADGAGGFTKVVKPKFRSKMC